MQIPSQRRDEPLPAPHQFAAATITSAENRTDFQIVFSHETSNSCDYFERLPPVASLSRSRAPFRICGERMSSFRDTRTRKSSVRGRPGILRRSKATTGMRSSIANRYRSVLLSTRVKPLDHVKTLRRPAEPRLVCEIRGIDNQRIAFPAANGVSIHSRMVFGRCCAFIRMIRASCTISVRIVTVCGVWTI